MIDLVDANAPPFHILASTFKQSHSLQLRLEVCQLNVKHRQDEISQSGVSLRSEIHQLTPVTIQWPNMLNCAMLHRYNMLQDLSSQCYQSQQLQHALLMNTSKNLNTRHTTQFFSVNKLVSSRKQKPTWTKLIKSESNENNAQTCPCHIKQPYTVYSSIFLIIADPPLLSLHSDHVCMDPLRSGLPVPRGPEDAAAPLLGCHLPSAASARRHPEVVARLLRGSPNSHKMSTLPAASTGSRLAEDLRLHLLLPGQESTCSVLSESTCRKHFGTTTSAGIHSI